MSHVKMGTMYVNQLMYTCTIWCHMGKMSDGLVKVGENDCWAQCHVGTMSHGSTNIASIFTVNQYKIKSWQGASNNGKKLCLLMCYDIF